LPTSLPRDKRTSNDATQYRFLVNFDRLSALPAMAETLFAEGLARYQAGEALAAAGLFAAVLDCTPDHGDALRLRGLALVRAGQARAALPLLARARRLAWREPLAHLHYGIGLLEAGRPARAAALFRRTVAMLPDDPSAWLNFSAALVALGQAPAARAAARRALAKAPQMAEAHYTLGLAERAARNMAGARAAFLRATELAPQLAEAWLNFGLAAFQLGRAGEAMQAMRRAVEVRPGFGAAEANIAGFMLLQGEHDEALALLRGVVERDPGCVAARLNLANAQLLDGEAAETIKLLRGEVPAGREGVHWRAHRATALLLARRPALAQAELDAIPEPYGDGEILIVWRRLVLAERGGDAEAVERLAERLAELVDEEGAALLEHRIIGHFDLAGFRNRHRDDERAFSHWRAGHRLLSRVQPFSRDQFHRFVDTSIAKFSAARLHEGPRATTTDETPVFIVGAPRSGTSLTEQILAAHAQVHGAGELANITRTIGALAGPPLQPPTVPRLAALDGGILSEAAERYRCDLRALAPEARLITDKMPGNALHLGFMATLLPGARVILCRRDPRDIGLSIFQLRFFGYHPYAHDLADLGWYIGEHERLMAHWRAVLPLPLLEVALTDWVEDFAGTLNRVLAFLDLPYDPACKQFHRQERRVRTASAAQVRQAINARGIGRWRRYQAWLGPMLAELDAAGLTEDAAELPSRSGP
jgi:tetratricopeptide (TPR) repeat protein